MLYVDAVIRATNRLDARELQEKIDGPEKQAGIKETQKEKEKEKERERERHTHTSHAKLVEERLAHCK